MGGLFSTARRSGLIMGGLCSAARRSGLCCTCSPFHTALRCVACSEHFLCQLFNDHRQWDMCPVSLLVLLPRRTNGNYSLPGRLF